MKDWKHEYFIDIIIFFSNIICTCIYIYIYYGLMYNGSEFEIAHI